MSLTTIKNESIQITVDSKGSELVSIKLINDATERLWQADEKYFSSHSPLLFPIVGGLRNDSYTYDGQSYHMTVHGFARDLLFTLIEKEETKLNYKLTYDEDTLQKFPFKFELYQKYEINENTVSISYMVKNIDNKDIYFSIGAHPAFNCPLSEGESMEDYYLEFEKAEEMEAYYKIGSDLSNDTRKIGMRGRKIKLSHELFYKGPLVFKRLNSNNVELKNNINSKTVKVEFAGFPYLGIWSSVNDGPFVCIEPWYGLGYVRESSDELASKEGIVRLEKEGAFSAQYNITI